ncbi:hypothetical protein HY485_04350 [Candidatus Woesearchaeota archaeon]|nr:hypothetical protein [Candidatus Woesearchaeota archaeon]
MGFTVIAPVGDDVKALFIGIKEFPTERVILITPPNRLKDAEQVRKKLEDFTIKTEIRKTEGNLMEDMFRIFGELCAIYPDNDLIVNVATGDRMSTCAALSAAFANGLKAIGVMDGKVMALPIMKLSYYKELSDKKLKILQKLSTNNFVSLKELCEKLNMSLSLLSYHISGNYQHQGLKELRLAEVKEQGKNLFVKLSEMGNLLLKGYITIKK